MSKRLVVAFDIDGVVFPWCPAAREAFETHRGYVDLMPSERWDHLKEQVLAKDWTWLWRGSGLKYTFDRTDLHYPGAPSALRKIGAIADLMFVTHRPRAASEFTARWIAAQRCHFTSLHVLGAHAHKSAYTQLADVVVDDKPEVVYDILENTKAHVFSPRHAYNVELELLNDPRFHFYDDIKEVTQWVRSHSPIPQ